MLYSSADDWLRAPRKRVLFFAMSGLGKTHVSNMLRAAGDWFHYSIDYRIGTRYMGEYITDNAKAHAMQVPFLRDLLLSDSIYIGSNITFENLTPVSTYLGKPGDPAKGGLPYAEYTRRQAQFRMAEIHALLDTAYFIDRAERLYGYPHFVCDTGGSICEWVDPDDPDDPLMAELSNNTLMVWIKGDDAHTAELIRRFDRAPKPMSYQPEFLDRVWTEYLNQNKLEEGEVDPDAFIRWTYAQALAHRQPRYEKMARNWGLTVSADDVARITTTEEFDTLIADTLAGH
ncbi:ATPase [Lutimaribacter sp. EGI FJ00015]|uniref:ATPase n=1 Tax=Lutimaribacter degradans TaxID=2945989 RepID=A0ACC5ZWG3_9RHOB|nr:ATPase [Lutimaribacter sp. EGI FJ00013]MCM2562101.1 ATPase [Lutimaribacter sp. EGI FJ00013]MCO0613254.1 ATPase [Lutimaribacter sp. EGI FJ00015]MCO0636231.1 ATPase [Lutimaribacter sp. EGI FJ00014]